MKTFIEEAKQEPLRTVKQQNFFGFPDDFNLSEWHLHKYLQGEYLDSKQGVTLQEFDSFAGGDYSINHNDKSKEPEVFFHCIGYRIKTNFQREKTCFLVLKKNKVKKV
jgi:hypothetical protein